MANDTTEYLKGKYVPSTAPGPSKWPPQDFPDNNAGEAFHALNQWAKELEAWGKRVTQWVDQADAAIKGTGLTSHIVGDPPPPPFGDGSV